MTIFSKMNYVIEAMQEDIENNTIGLNIFPENFEGTLIYGYDIDRNTFHAYVKNGKFFVLTYAYDPESKNGYHLLTSDIFNKNIPISSLLPTKRVYPNRSLQYIIDVLSLRGVHVPLTSDNKDESHLKIGEFTKDAMLIEDFN